MVPGDRRNPAVGTGGVDSRDGDPTAVWSPEAVPAQADIPTGAGTGIGGLATLPAPAARSQRAERADSLIGARLADRYRIVRLLGRGGMGEVYLAEHVTLRKPVAIKVLSDRDFGTLPIGERFLQEARAASMIRHENVVDITDFGETPRGTAFYAMEYLEGEDLKALLDREGRLPWGRARTILLQICRALAAAHRKGVVHRDMKPANCFRTEREGQPDFIKVVDFGIAKVMQDGVTVENLTQTGAIIGTPEYMSPEQARGSRLDARADVYSVGVMMYEMLTGRVPFGGDSFLAVLTAHLLDPPAPPRTIAPDAGITPAIEHVVLRALQKQPDDRYQSIDDLAKAIRDAGDADPAALPSPARPTLPSSPGHTVPAPAASPPSSVGWTYPAVVAPSPPSTIDRRHSHRVVALAVGGALVVLVGGITFAAMRFLPADVEPPSDSAAALDAEPEAPIVEASQLSPPPAVLPEAPAVGEPPVESERPPAEPERATAIDGTPPAATVQTAPAGRPARTSSPTKTTKPVEPSPQPLTPSPAPEPARPPKITKEHAVAVKGELDGETQRCFTEQGGSAGMKVRATVVVAPSGEVSSVTVADTNADTPVGTCIRAVLDRATFPSTDAGGKVQLSFTAR